MSVHPLLPEQRRAADPAASAWVSASAGTGKTQVLTARVLRLLLAGARPDGLLALTFTKAAAAEMQTRIFETLGRWVRATDPELNADLAALGAAADDAARTRARTLFAYALEAKGGLKVQTLHSFAGALLSAFPLEANVAPGFETLDDRTALALRADALANAVAAAEAGDAAFLNDLAELAVRRGETAAREMTAKLLKHPQVLASLAAMPDGGQAALRRALGAPGQGDRLTVLAKMLGDDVFDWRRVRDYAAALEAWGTKQALARAEVLARVLGAAAEDRAVRFAGLLEVAFTAGGEGDAWACTKKNDPGFAALHGRFCAAVGEVRDVLRALEVADIAGLHLRVGARLAAGYEAAKAHAGALDFDDLIARAAGLLQSLDAPYVLYKLDQRIDHVLVDEGQDTNADQWTIVDAIAEEFFAGEGARDEDEAGPRTQFAVGDYKQAIFSFQGTDPDEFERARRQAEARAMAAAKPFEQVDLSLSFRSVPAILDVVDQLVADAGPAAFGLDAEIPAHRAHRKGAGAVVLWPPISGADGASDEEEAGWVSDSELLLAERIAAEIAEWLATPMILPAKGRAVRPEDVLILVRSRGELVSALVAALHKAHVPVAGADRLRLTQPIAVQDVLALARFALQPGDDLSLAALLVSPFLGWTQEDLFGLAHGRRSTLWRALRDASDKGAPQAAAAEAWLGQVLARADYAAPYEFFEFVLSGGLGGRARLLARLGEEARDPIEEVLNQALAYEVANTPSLQGFLAWLEADDVDVKRDPETPLGAVRIMTAHGAKGLQAPVVILADAAKAVPKGAREPLTMALPGIGEVPVFYRSKTLLSGAALRAHEAATRAEAEEHMRLLYVAMTRAEDLLFVGGALGKRASKKASWHDHVGAALRALGAEPVSAPRWSDAGEVLRHAAGAAATQVREPLPAGKADFVLPDWAATAAPAEERPPRPLAPSADTGEDAALPPSNAAMQRAAKRGRVLHALFERLGPVPDRERAPAIRAWLKRNAAELDADEIVAEVLAVMEAPAFAELFGDDALSEAPLSAVVGERVISGTIDKLLIGADTVRALDFKTGMNVPASAAEVPAYHLRQMQAYREALARIFRGRRIEVALLYTAGPKLIEIA